MRSMNFDASAAPVPLKRAGTLGIAVAVHLLALLAFANFERARFGTTGEQVPPARFFVDVSIKSLFQRIEPVRDGAPSVAAPTAGSLISPSDAARGDVEVLITPRATDTVRLQLPAARTADVARSDKVAPAVAAPSATASASAVPAQVSTDVAAAAVTSAQPRGVQDDTPKVIGIDSIGMSSATYTFPALTGESADAPPRMFKVEIGNYPDIETAILNHVIDQIRARYPDEITWDSKNRGGIVRLSMRLKDHDELVKFLRSELFNKRLKTIY